MSTRKKLTNSKENLEKEIMEAISLLYSGLHVDVNLKVVMLNRDRKFRVALLAGGGCGHEPYPAGFVGEGMLTAAVMGNLFASPPIDNVLATIRSLAKLNLGGILLLVNNYPVEVLNFAAAMEIARTKNCNVELLILTDDISEYGIDIRNLTGRKGLVGIVLIAKILGGYSSEGKGMKELVYVGRCLNCRIATYSMCFQFCTLPDSVEPMVLLEENSVEFGVGINGETGIFTGQLVTLKDLVRQMLIRILSYLMLEEGSEVVALINNLGSFSQMEMLIISREIKLQIEAMKFKVVRIYSGAFMTCIDMRGFQICLLNVTGNPQWLVYLDTETEAFGWPGRRISHVIEQFPPRIDKIRKDHAIAVEEGMILDNKNGENFRKCLFSISRALIEECDNLNQLDAIIGDGDCGTSLRHFAEGLLKELYRVPVTDVASTLGVFSKLSETLMSGASSAIFTLLFLGASRDCENWETCWMSAIELFQKYTRARSGDRTLLDALIPACQGFMVHLKENGDHSWPIALKVALERAEQGCELTKTMEPRFSIKNFAGLNQQLEVDPGAYVVVIVLRSIVNTLVPADEDNIQCPL